MKILSLKLENFRGIKELTVNFDGKNTDIYGANGLGKTTVANAICWLLIDRPATEEPNFDPKTTGVHGTHHYASIKLELDGGEQMTFAKDFYEKFTQKKSSATKEFTGHNTDYFIDGVKSKQKDYNATIERVLGVSANIAKVLLVLPYFADSMKTEEKRKILFEMCGEFTDEDVFNANKELDDLKDFLLMPGTTDKFYTLDQWKQIAADGRKKLNKDLELLPTRIDEAQKSIPETLPDVEELQIKLKQLESQKDDLEEEKRSLATEDGQKDATRSAIAALNTELETKKTAYIKRIREMNAETNASIDKLTAELRVLDNDTYRYKAQLTETKNKISDMESKRQTMINEYAATKQEVWDKGAEICPACGQNLPPDKVEELRAAFNKKKSEKLISINQKGKTECSQAMIDAAKKEFAELEVKLENAIKNHADVYGRFQNLHNAIVSEPPFEDTEEYSELSKRISELKERANQGANVANEAENALISKIGKVKTAIANVNMEIANAKRAKESQDRVETLSIELKTAAEKLERLEYGIHLCEEFTRTKAKMLTDSINQHFSRVKFILFRDQINGGLKEVCEPTAQNKAGEWVEYRSLNFADKVNSQLDIVNTLNKHYGVNLPVIIDQAESVTNPMRIEEQVIRLIVSATDNETFRIVTRD